MNKYRFDTFANENCSEKVSVDAYVGNGHGVHTNKFPVNYEELFDVPEDIVFRTNQCIISSAYCRLDKSVERLSKDGVTAEQVIRRISDGLLWKGREGLYHSDLATKDCVMTYLRYVKTSSFPISVYSFDRLLEFEKDKTMGKIISDKELEIFNQIMSITEVSDGEPILSTLLEIDDSEFKKAALLLLKCKVYDIEDQHYLRTKIHDQNEAELLKTYRKKVFSQR